MRHVFILLATLLCGVGSPASAGELRLAAHSCYGCSSHTIYGLNNLIAYLEANPDVDDGLKGPVITRARAKIYRLRAAGLYPPQPVYPVPCCYRRRPLYIR